MSILDSSQRVAEKSFQKGPSRKLHLGRDLQRFADGQGTRIFGLIYSASLAAQKTVAEPFGSGRRKGNLDQSRRIGRAAPIGGTWKQCFDFGVALAAIMIMAPIMIAIALLILATMGRPVIFVQERIGFGKKPFRCFKFRTMVPDAQERLTQHLSENSEAARLWQETQKLKDDPRITWFGHVLRKSSLDELPQLFNILRGEMSCVGPRPVLASELQRYGIHAADYAKAKPGLTGIWQVSGRSNTTYAHRVNCDRYYVRRWSAVLDLWIMLRTIPAVLRVRDTA